MNPKNELLWGLWVNPINLGLDRRHSSLGHSHLEPVVAQTQKRSQKDFDFTGPSFILSEMLRDTL